MIGRMKAYFRRRERVAWFGRNLAAAREVRAAYNRSFEEGYRFGPYGTARHNWRWYIAKKEGRKWVVVDDAILSSVAIKKVIKLGGQNEYR